MSNLNFIVGLAAAVLTTLAFVPQVVKVWKTRSTSDISLKMYVAFTLGSVLWLVYGLLIDSWPVILANAVTAILSGSVLVMKIRYG
jgi:MtN3 and saliva related transmembrane protein